MKSFVIRVDGNSISEKGAENLINSSKKVNNDFDIELFDAVTPNMTNTIMSGNGLKWKYPWEGQETDLKTGLIKSAYPTKVKENRIACALSHWILWQQCRKYNVPFIIFEHDAFFIEKLDPTFIFENKNYDIVVLTVLQRQLEGRTNFMISFKVVLHGFNLFRTSMNLTSHKVSLEIQHIY